MEGAAEGVDETKTEEGKDKTSKPSDDKAKAASGDKGKDGKTPDNKAKTVPGDKGKAPSKETKKK